MLLRHSAGMSHEAADLETAIDQVLEAGHRTADIARPGHGKAASTSEMGALVEEAFVAMLDRRFSYHAV
jgi:3-isopropylmalate dehydrogenase